ncbi:DEAD/DEAH box helicase [Anaerophilus nitritogenes]|uniref:DEAD/DEAH box helicase n=1 Tax=Anaerophilus nitritogenes TaxID=2498136 RepID=UPI00101C4B36|nr:DEAD/DEAH box helicase [Anaerophilus nitritogenes]
MKTFSSYTLKDFIVNNLQKNNLVSPTPIQETTLIDTLEGKDLIGKAKTGTGKTLAYLLPMIQKIDTSSKDIQTLVLAPTKELSIQIKNEAQKIIEGTSIRIEAIVEGMKIEKQLDQMKNKPHMIIATPGRFVHLMSIKKIKLHEVKIIALDEVDEILKAGLLDKVQFIMNNTLKDRQILSFSATISKEAKDLLTNKMKNPIIAYLDQDKPIPSTIYHQYMVTKASKKTDALEEILKSIKPSKSLVFINKNENVDRFVKELKSLGFLVGGIQTRTKNQDRQNTLTQFNKGKIKILVTTDLFTRGMDFQKVSHVFNMDLPFNETDYLHRAGRTGRIGQEGTVINIVRDREKFILYKMMKKLNIKVDHIDVMNGKIVLIKDFIQRKNNR